MMEMAFHIIINCRKSKWNSFEQECKVNTIFSRILFSTSFCFSIFTYRVTN